MVINMKKYFKIFTIIALGIVLFSMTSCNKSNNDNKDNIKISETNDNTYQEEPSNNLVEEKTVENPSNKKIEVSDDLEDGESWDGILF